MVSLQLVEGLPPGGFAGVLDVSEILLVAERDGVAFDNSGDDDFFPCGHMQNQFPNTMPCGDGVRGRSRCVNVSQYFHEGRAVPGLAVEGTLELVNDEFDLHG